MKILMFVILLIGLLEIISNIFHFTKGSVDRIGQSAKRQHQELPLNIDDRHFFIKAVIMFIFGIIFFLVAGIYFINVHFNTMVAFVILLVFGVYGIVQALVYRKTINVWASAVVYNIPVVVFYFLK